jgi:hypothetical protein
VFARRGSTKLIASFSIRAGTNGKRKGAKAMAFSKKESELITQLPTFANGIAANIGIYQVSQPEADTCVAAVEDFVAKYNAWHNPATRTPGALEAKNAALFSALSVCRVFYRAIQLNNGISNEAKVEVGVTPFSGVRVDRNCPITSPSVTVTASTPLAQTTQFRDSTGLVPRGLPMGATMCQLFVEVGEENAEVFDITKARFVGNYTTNPMPVIFNPEDRGKQATYFARWGGRRNEFGQWSLPVSMTIAA